MSQLSFYPAGAIAANEDAPDLLDARIEHSRLVAFRRFNYFSRQIQQERAAVALSNEDSARRWDEARELAASRTSSELRERIQNQIIEQEREARRRDIGFFDRVESGLYFLSTRLLLRKLERSYDLRFDPEKPDPDYFTKTLVPLATERMKRYGLADPVVSMFLSGQLEDVQSDYQLETYVKYEEEKRLHNLVRSTSRFPSSIVEGFLSFSGDPIEMVAFSAISTGVGAGLRVAGLGLRGSGAVAREIRVGVGGSYAIGEATIGTAAKKAAQRVGVNVIGQEAEHAVESLRVGVGLRGAAGLELRNTLRALPESIARATVGATGLNVIRTSLDPNEYNPDDFADRVIQDAAFFTLLETILVPIRSALGTLGVQRQVSRLRRENPPVEEIRREPGQAQPRPRPTAKQLEAEVQRVSEAETAFREEPIVDVDAELRARGFLTDQERAEAKQFFQEQEANRARPATEQERAAILDEIRARKEAGAQEARRIARERQQRATAQSTALPARQEPAFSELVPDVRRRGVTTTTEPLLLPGELERLSAAVEQGAARFSNREEAENDPRWKLANWRIRNIATSLGIPTSLNKLKIAGNRVRVVNQIRDAERRAGVPVGSSTAESLRTPNSSRGDVAPPQKGEIATAGALAPGTKEPTEVAIRGDSNGQMVAHAMIAGASEPIIVRTDDLADFVSQQGIDPESYSIQEAAQQRDEAFQDLADQANFLRDLIRLGQVEQAIEKAAETPGAPVVFVPGAEDPAHLHFSGVGKVIERRGSRVLVEAEFRGERGEIEHGSRWYSMHSLRPAEMVQRGRPMPAMIDPASGIPIYEIDQTSKAWADLPNDVLARAAFGFAPEDLEVLFPDQIHIKYGDDMLQAETEASYDPAQWAAQVDLSEPVEVSFEDGRFVLEDGHHRYVAAQIRGEALNVDVTIKDSPGEALTRAAIDQGYQVPPKTLALYPKLENTVAPLDKDGSELASLDDTPAALNEDGSITLYHRTTAENAQAITQSGRWISREGDEVFFSNRKSGEAESFGEAIVQIEIDPALTRLDDAFGRGEIHVAITVRDLEESAKIIGTEPNERVGMFGQQVIPQRGVTGKKQLPMFTEAAPDAVQRSENVEGQLSFGESATIQGDEANEQTQNQIEAEAGSPQIVGQPVPEEFSAPAKYRSGGRARKTVEDALEKLPFISPITEAYNRLEEQDDPMLGMSRSETLPEGLGVHPDTLSGYEGESARKIKSKLNVGDDYSSTEDFLGPELVDAIIQEALLGKAGTLSYFRQKLIHDPISLAFAVTGDFNLPQAVFHAWIDEQWSNIQRGDFTLRPRTITDKESGETITLESDFETVDFAKLPVGSEFDIFGEPFEITLTEDGEPAIETDAFDFILPVSEIEPGFIDRDSLILGDGEPLGTPEPMGAAGIGTLKPKVSPEGAITHNRMAPTNPFSLAKQRVNVAAIPNFTSRLVRAMGGDISATSIANTSDLDILRGLHRAISGRGVLLNGDVHFDARVVPENGTLEMHLGAQQGFTDANASAWQNMITNAWAELEGANAKLANFTSRFWVRDGVRDLMEAMDRSFASWNLARVLEGKMKSITPDQVPLYEKTIEALEEKHRRALDEFGRGDQNSISTIEKHYRSYLKERDTAVQKLQRNSNYGAKLSRVNRATQDVFAVTLNPKRVSTPADFDLFVADLQKLTGKTELHDSAWYAKEHGIDPTRGLDRIVELFNDERPTIAIKPGRTLAYDSATGDVYGDLSVLFDPTVELSRINTARTRQEILNRQLEKFFIQDAYRFLEQAGFVERNNPDTKPPTSVKHLSQILEQHAAEVLPDYQSNEQVRALARREIAEFELLLNNLLKTTLPQGDHSSLATVLMGLNDFAAGVLLSTKGPVLAVNDSAIAAAWNSALHPGFRGAFRALTRALKAAFDHDADNPLFENSNVLTTAERSWLKRIAGDDALRTEQIASANKELATRQTFTQKVLTAIMLTMKDLSQVIFAGKFGGVTVIPGANMNATMNFVRRFGMVTTNEAFFGHLPEIVKIMRRAQTRGIDSETAMLQLVSEGSIDSKIEPIFLNVIGRHFTLPDLQEILDQWRNGGPMIGDMNGSPTLVGGDRLAVRYRRFIDEAITSEGGVDPDEAVTPQKLRNSALGRIFLMFQRFVAAISRNTGSTIGGGSFAALGIFGAYLIAGAFLEIFLGDVVKYGPSKAYAKLKADTRTPRDLVQYTVRVFERTGLMGIAGQFVSFANNVFLGDPWDRENATQFTVIPPSLGLSIDLGRAISLIGKKISGGELTQGDINLLRRLTVISNMMPSRVLLDLVGLSQPLPQNVRRQTEQDPETEAIKRERDRLRELLKAGNE